MVFDATFNNISVISWQSVLLVEETGETTDLPQVTDKHYHIMLYQEHLVCAGFELTTLVVICSDYTGSCKSNYHTITTAPTYFHKGIKMTQRFCICVFAITFSILSAN